LKPSVTVLLPIHNAQHRLEQQVAEILDVLPELTNRFELLIIDDGSTDDSFEVAHHLSVKYPQVSAVRHASQLGLAQAVRSGLDETNGELVLVGDQQHGVRADDLRRLWHSYAVCPAAESADEGEPAGQHRIDAMAPAGRGGWFEKMITWRPHRRQSQPEAETLDVSQWKVADPAAEIARGIQRRLDKRERSAARPAAVPPLYREQGRRPAGTGGTERGSVQRGPNDRRQSG